MPTRWIAATSVFAVALAACTPAARQSERPAAPTATTTVIAPLFPDVVTTRATTTTTLPFDTTDDTTRRRMEDDLLTLLDIGPRPAGSPAEWQTGDWLLATLVGITGQPLRTNANETRFFLAGDLLSRNVDAVLGRASLTNPADLRVILAAPYGSPAGSAGIDANGSGVAVVLEVARRVVADPVRGLELVVSFVAAGDGMTTGTQVAADRPRVRADVVVALDTVGTGSPFVALTADDVAVEREIGLLELIAERSGASVEAVVDVSGLHGAFWLAGVPSLTLTRPGNERVGLPADTVADLDALLEDVDLVETFLRNLALAADT